MAEGGGRRAFDREQLRHRFLMAWSDSIDCEIARFRVAVARGRARRQGDATALAELDQVGAGLRDEWRRARGRLRRLRGELRRLRSGDRAGLRADVGEVGHG